MALEITKEDEKIVDSVEKAVCAYFSVTERDILSKNNKATISLARGMTFYILHYDYEFSINRIATIYFRCGRGVKFLISRTKANIKHFKHIKDMYVSVKEKIK